MPESNQSSPLTEIVTIGRDTPEIDKLRFVTEAFKKAHDDRSPETQALAALVLACYLALR